MKHKTYKQAYYENAQGSRCNALFSSYNNPNFIKITLTGPIAKVPSLKNQKIQNTNVLRPEAKAKLALMTDLFRHACAMKVPRYEKSVELFCYVSFAHRTRSFDEDNAATTIKDWLEPSFIRKKERGWGVGIIENDKAVKIFTAKKQKSDKDSDKTEIFIRPYLVVKEFEDQFIKAVTNYNLK